jgi:cyclase
MLRPRVIPCLLIHRGGLAKTVRFRDHKYVGDPLNAVRIFNEKEVDELVVLDIDATVAGKEPDYTLIKNLARECRMPLCYGGGVTSADQVERIISLGVEKVAISSAAIERPSLIRDAADHVGSQSVVVVLDVRKAGLLRTRYELFTRNGTNATGIAPADFAARAQELGAGEILVNSIDRDGTLEGYDLALAEEVRRATSVPLSILGGAGSQADLAKLVSTYGLVGACAGSLFVFKGKYRAVLIQYPSREDKERLIAGAMGLAIADAGQ